MVNRIVDKANTKYILALDFLNHILTNNNKPNINDILDFKDITRQEILKQENLNKLNEIEVDIYIHFNKDKCGYYRKTNNYTINFFRQMIKELGYKAVIEKKDRTIDSFVDWINTKTKKHQTGGKPNKKKSKRKSRNLNGGKWSRKYKRGINCRRPRGFSQKQYCKYGRKQ